MKIKIKNCNNIDDAEIKVKEKELNIKYGPNGVGKSTIAEVLELHLMGESLETLIPYKYLGKKDENIQPNIKMDKQINKINVFNEEYIDRFLFNEDEIIENSFNIFVKTAEYEKHMMEIENRLKGITDKFKNNNKLDKLIADLSNLETNLGKDTKDGFSKTGALRSGLENGNKLEYIPDNLSEYKPFLQQEEGKNIEWIAWQQNGIDFLGPSNHCPFCVTKLSEANKTKIMEISNTFNKKMLKSIQELLKLFNDMKEYLTKEANEEIQKIIVNQDGLNSEHLNYLKILKGEALLLRNQLSALKNIDFFELRKLDIKNLEKELEKYKINLELTQNFKSEYTQNQIEGLNQAIDQQLKEIGILKGQVNIQQQLIIKTINEHQKIINEFLQKAGYSYEVTITDEESKGEYKALLKPISNEVIITSAKQCLSYGEKNAFALILFMFDALRNDSDFIILDDPISSFDTHKKYAIIDMLFQGGKSFNNKTVLLLTHDFDPVYDMIWAKHRDFQETTNASFLENKNGNLIEKEIKKENIESIISILQKNIMNSKHIIYKLINLRRVLELTNNKGIEWNLLSSLFHCRPHPTDIEEKALNEIDIEKATEIIEKLIGEPFNYNKCLALLNDFYVMKEAYDKSENGYEKVQIIRLLNDKEGKADKVFKKFLDETYHVQNNYIYQLNPSEYETVPQYVIDWCDQYIKELEKEYYKNRKIAQLSS